MKRLLGIFAVLSFVVSTSAAFAADLVWPSREKLFVGFSQADLKSTWRTVENDDIKAEAAKRGYKFAMTNAEGDTGKQISDIESLLAQGANALVVVPIDADAILPALQEAKERGVPVILKSRGSNGKPGVDYVTGIMSDFVWEGNQAGKWISAAAKKKGLTKVRVIEIQGVIGGTDVRDRGQGFQNAADEAGNFEFVATQSADWSRSKAQELVQNLIQSKGKTGFDAIYAQNDEMALGATLALQQAGLVVNKDVFLVGVDGMKEAFDAIKSDKLSASVTCTPKFAAQVFDTIESGIAGKPIPGSLAVNDALVDSTNVDKFYTLGF